MEDHSVYSIPAYLVEHFFYASIFVLWLQSLGIPVLTMPHTGSAMSMRLSFGILAGMTVLSVVVGMAMTIRRYRTFFHVLVHIWTPLGLYFLAVLLDCAPRLAAVQGVLLVVVLVVYLLLLCSDLPQEGRWEQLRRRFRGFPRRAWALLSVVLLLSPVSYYAARLTGHPLDLQAPQTDLEALEEARASLIGLRDEKWETLSQRKRISLLQEVLEIESGELGLTYVPELEVSDLEEGLLGSYIYGYDHIVISRTQLMEERSWSSVRTVCHEVYHAYQEMQVDLYETVDSKYQSMELFRDAAVYAQEFDHYRSGRGEDGDFDAYYDQQCETDARAYAAARTEAYYNALTDHQGE